MSSSTLPPVTIIMPIKNEQRYIERSLGAVLAQDYPTGLLEVLVVDGNSSDRTRELISNLALASKLPITILDNPTGIVPKALNIGLRHGKGDIIIRVDGHCEIQKNYVKVCVNQLLQQEVECVGGTIETIGETFIAKTIAIAMSTTLGVGNVAFRVSRGSTQLTDSVPFPAYPRRIFEQIGSFDEEMLCNEDDEFNYRLMKNNGRILLVNDLRTRYFSRGSLKSLWGQYFRYGFWKVRLLQKHPRQMSLRQYVPPLFVVSLLLAVVIALIFSWGWLILAAILVAYLLANLAVSFWASARRGWQHLTLLPLVYAILHLSYGSGFLIGLIKFANRWGDKTGKVPAWEPKSG